MALCFELLTSSISPNFLFGAFSSLNQAVTAEFIEDDLSSCKMKSHPLPSLVHLIECLKGAVKVRSPDLYHTLLALANQPFNRIVKTHSNADYEEESSGILSNSAVA